MNDLCTKHRLHKTKHKWKKKYVYTIMRNYINYAETQLMLCPIKHYVRFYASLRIDMCT